MIHKWLKQHRWVNELVVLGWVCMVIFPLMGIILLADVVLSISTVIRQLKGARYERNHK